jgi:hypothetical protein
MAGRRSSRAASKRVSIIKWVTSNVGLGEERMSDAREPSYSYIYIDRIIWAVLVIAIIGIGGLVGSNLQLLSDSQMHH